MLSYGEAIAGVGSRREAGIITWDEGLKTLEDRNFGRALFPVCARALAKSRGDKGFTSCAGSNSFPSPTSSDLFRHLNL
jgi:hypothetical protein